MADATVDDAEVAPKKKSKLPLLLGLIVALLGGGGAFFAIYSGMIMAPPEVEEVVAEPLPASRMPLDSVAFVPIDPLSIALGRGSNSESAYLKFEAQLEVPKQYESSVQNAMPRIIDVLNTYLRAVEIRDLENPGMLPELRAQMLRRLQVTTEPGHVHDLLIQEFIIN